MKRKLVLTIAILGLTTAISHGQTIQEIFKALPLEYTPELTKIEKDSLIMFGTYILPGGDSLEMSKYDYNSDTENYIHLESSYINGPSGFFVIELRKFTKQDGKVIVVYAKYGGGPRMFDQHELIVFDYSSNKFTLNKTIKLPSTIEAKEFLKNPLPKNFNKHYSNSLSSSYDLNPSDIEGVEYMAYPQVASDEVFMETQGFIYKWNGDTFLKSKRKN